MAYREVAMWVMLKVLRRLEHGEGVQKVGLATGHARKTVRRYRDLSAELGLVVGLYEPDKGLALEVFQQLRPRPKDEAPGETELLLEHRERRAAQAGDAG